MTIHDVYATLADGPRAFVTREWRLSLRLRETWRYLAVTPYPLDSAAAGYLDGAVRGYVIPWDEVRDRFVPDWVRDGYLAAGAMPLAGTVFPEDQDPSAFADPDEFEEWAAGGDFSHGLADVRDADFLYVCDSLLSVIRADAEATPGEAGSFVPLPLPFGPPALGRVPLVEGEWVDRYAVELAEHVSDLAAGGYTILPPFDPHVLARHRLYPPRTDWKAPREADADRLRDAFDKTCSRLTRCPGPRREVGGREYLRFPDYAGWAGRSVPGDLVAARREGLVVGHRRVDP